MQSFSTEFPVQENISGGEFLSAVKDWIVGSRYTYLKASDLEQIGSAGESKVTVESDTVEILRVDTDDTESIAVSYHKRDDNCDWISTIVFSGTPSSNWVSVRVMCEPHLPTAKLPEAKKPVVMQILLSKLGGGTDGKVQVTDKAVMLSESQVELAASYILGTNGAYLPIVYISAPFRGKAEFNFDALAKQLAGMAHVVVEPSRAFSIRLKDIVHAQNVYGGAVGVYWSEGGGSRKFLEGRNISESIFHEIRLALNNRRPLIRCTWNSVKEIQSRKILNELRDAGSTDVQNYIDAFDAELNAKNAALTDAEKEIHRLSAEIRRLEARSSAESGMMLELGQEQDYFENEIKDIVLDALTHAVGSVTIDSRRQHVLNAILNANSIAQGAQTIRERLKASLRDYRSLDSKTEKELEACGFSISDTGKHFKLTWMDDDRYTFTLAKTASDHRTGLNSALDIGRLFL
ncbi:hypothetical protein [Duganella levis]|uniref:Phage tail protein n=1 Tax=Duganella levis TaxID=2692169 RepID=A0ABW9W823_9BURK|nr:hypothetical protein [Duganella levis]MYN30232.1 hypothetical protein [Duganella levis]